MAHATTLGELAGGLVNSMTGISNDDIWFRPLKERTVKGLRDSSHVRTNQFEVNERYAGLIEKFGVLNRDDLADTLQSRLESLPVKGRFTPDVLSFLLQLSDRPLENTHIEDLERLTRANTPPAPLTWEEIVADDPPTDDDIWDDVERGYHSSGDDATVDDADSEPPSSTQATSSSEEDFAALAQLHVVQRDASLLDDIRLSKQALLTTVSSKETRPLSELAIIREILSMLRGLPTYLFQVSHGGAVIMKTDCTITTATSFILQDVVVQCTDIGTRLNYLRHWISSQQDMPYIQSVQGSMEQTLGTFNLQLGALEQGYFQPQPHGVVSIIATRTEVETLVRPVVRLSDIVARVVSAGSAETFPFAMLDSLYEEACIAHVAGDEQLSAAIGSTLLAGLRTCLRSVHAWLETGTLPSDESESKSFFVCEADRECLLGTFWHKRFALRLLPDGRVCAPEITQPFVRRAFAMGKSRAFMGLLDRADDAASTIAASLPAMLNFEATKTCLGSNTLQAFPHLLYEILDNWMAATGTDCAPHLRTTMLNHGGVLDTVQALEYVFLAKDGALLQDFTEPLYDRIRRRPNAWKDRLLFTELAQNTLGTAPGVDARCLSVDFSDNGCIDASDSIVRQMGQLRLVYAVPWSMQNITCSQDLRAHSSAFSFILHVEYADSLLRLQVFDLRRLEKRARELPRSAQLALALRARLLCFVSTLRAHIFSTAALRIDELRQQTRLADGIDSMADIWATYDKHLQAELLLAPRMSPIRDSVINILQLCETLTSAWTSLLKEVNPPEAMLSLSEEFGRLLSFSISGLRGVGRAGGETALESLAERLAWSGG